MNNNIKTTVQYVKNFHFNSIFIRNLILIALAMLIPLITVCTIFYTNTQKAVNTEISIISQENAATIKNVTDNILRTTEILAIQTALNDNVQSLCLPSAENNHNITNVYRQVKEYIRGYTNIYPYLNSIYVYSQQLGTVIESQEIVSVKNHEDSGWFSYYENGTPEETIIVSRKKSDRYPYFISIIKAIYIDGIGKVGCVVINIDTEELYKLIGNIDSAVSNHIIMYNNENQVLLCPDLKQTGKSLSSYIEVENPTEILQNDFSNIKIQEQSYMYAKKMSNHYDLTYLLLIPKSYFDSIMLRPVGFLLLIFFLTIIISLCLAIWISLKIYSPIQNIMDTLLPIYSIDTHNNNNTNEIIYITNAIKNTLSKTDSLTTELSNRMLILKEAQTYALQTQINPHFLNNTLESINWTAINKLGEENKISKMIKSLSALLDISLNTEHYLIPISEELQHTNIYIYIMNLNYSSDLKFSWNFDDNISHYKIIKLSLQPILENAVVHGINPNRGVGEITINGRLYQDDIMITISDDGVGMEPEELGKLQKELNSNTIHGKHIGLKNVNQRIKLIFGEKYGVSITSEKGKGTTVTLLFPKIEI